jgi:membrane-associated phospholipid phosphatase
LAFRLQLILFGIVAAIATIDVLWVNAGHFDADATGFGAIALLATILAGAGVYYERVRKEERLAAMLIGTSFLIGMSASFSLLNYLLLTVAGRRIDVPLAALDRALGVDWPALMRLAAQHPLIAAGLQLAYISVLPQVAVLVALLGWRGRHESIYGYCIALTAGAAISISVWVAAPSFGAFSVYALPANVGDHLALALDGAYAKDLVALLAHGPGHISPTDAKGLIGFPSFHAVMAMLVVWYGRHLSYVRWFALALNSIVLVATPIEGGHHVVDVLAGFAVATAAVLFADWIVRRAAAAHAPLAITTQAAGV